MFLIAIQILFLVKNCFSAGNDWVDVEYVPAHFERQKPRSMSEGNGSGGIRPAQQFVSSNVPQNRMSHSLQNYTESLQRNAEQQYFALENRIKLISEQLKTQGIDERTRKELRKELVDLKIQATECDEIKTKNFLKGPIRQSTRDRLEAFCLLLAVQREALVLKYFLITEQFNPYVESILTRQHAIKSEDIAYEENLLSQTRQRSGSEEILMSENKVLRAQKEQLMIENAISLNKFSPYVKQLLDTQYIKEAAKFEDLNVRVKELEIIEIEDVLKDPQLGDKERKELEVKLLTLKWHIKNNELVKIEKTIKSPDFASLDDECIFIDADILRTEVRMIEIDGKIKTQNMPSEQKGLLLEELERLKIAVQFLEIKKQYISIHRKLKTEPLQKGEQIRLEMNFAFLQSKLLINCKKKDEAEEMLSVLDSYKATYKEMERIEGLFRKDQEMRFSTESSASAGGRVGDSGDIFILKNYIKYYLAKKYQELFNQIRRNTIERFLNRESMLKELGVAAREWFDIHHEHFVLTPEQYSLFGTKELTSRESLDQFLVREQIAQETIEGMKREYWCVKERMPFVKLPNGRHDFVEDTTRTIYEYGLIESYLLSDDQCCLLGIKYLELSGLDSITVEFLEEGGPVYK